MIDSYRWVTQLQRRHARVLAAQSQLDDEQRLRLNSLQLADAVLRKCTLSESHPDHALQIAVIGPTQSGKSTLVNVLLDVQAAGISALAGFTVHAQGYATQVDDTALQLIEPLMAPLARVPASNLSHSDLNTFVLEPVDGGRNALITPAIVWDTPDFDSIDAGSYKQAVMNSIAIADMTILMVSKDKYGDKSVWDLLELTGPLQQPLLVCINKLDPRDEATVVSAFKSRYQSLFNTAVPPITLLPFVRREDQNASFTLPAERLQQLQQALIDRQSTINRYSANQHVKAFINQHRKGWMAPLVAERQAALQWQEMVDSAMAQAEAEYSRDFLNNHDRYDTFNRALAELLTLLEIPGIAPALIRTRQMVTWPARKLLGLGRDVINQERETGKSVLDQEADTLERIVDSTLITLQGQLMDQAQEPYWIALSGDFRNRKLALREACLIESVSARKDFEPQIEAAAKRLYAQLQSQPALLNTLRAARATADAAGVALAIKSGGIAPADLILAPAMLSVTTLLTESALGKFMDSVKAELKERQLEHIRSRLLEGVLAYELMQLTQSLPGEALYAQDLEQELLIELEAEAARA